MTNARRRWGVACPTALGGLLIGTAVGFVAAPHVIALPGLLAAAGLGIGLLMGLLVAWRRPPAPDTERACDIDRHAGPRLAPWTPAPPPDGDGDPGWYPDPHDDRARRYWDGELWTDHLWRDRVRERTRRDGS